MVGWWNSHWIRGLRGSKLNLTWRKGLPKIGTITGLPQSWMLPPPSRCTGCGGGHMGSPGLEAGVAVPECGTWVAPNGYPSTAWSLAWSAFQWSPGDVHPELGPRQRTTRALGWGPVGQPHYLNAKCEAKCPFPPQYRHSLAWHQHLHSSADSGWVPVALTGHRSEFNRTVRHWPLFLS